MPPLSNTHRVSYESIRSLAIECHALELSAFTLLEGGTHQPSRGTKLIYEELLTSKLLMLAIALRTKFDQGLSSIDTDRYIGDSGSLDSTTNGVLVECAFSIRDVCNKIIHADSISRTQTDRESGLITTFDGALGKVAWKLTISVSLFVEGVLNWLDDLPDA